MLGGMTTTAQADNVDNSTNGSDSSTQSNENAADLTASSTTLRPSTTREKSATTQPAVTPTSGSVTPESTTARLANDGSVQVNYQDSSNANVGTSTLNGPVGTDYHDQVAANVPSGYVLGDHQIPAGTFTKEGSTISVTVDPMPANKRGTATINYETVDGQIVKTISATGFVGDQIDAGSYLPEGYTIADKDQRASGGSLYDTNPQTLTVYVQPGSNQALKDSLTKQNTPTDGTELPLSDGTALGLREKVDGLQKDQYANSKINVSNIVFNKQVIKESEKMDLTVTFDWDAIGIRKGDVMVTPMSPAFDSTTRLPLFHFSSASITDMGILVLDYDKQLMYVEFRKDLDPTKVYHGTMTIGTFINRQFFKNIDDDYTFNIPTPNGDIVQRKITVEYDQAGQYDKVFTQAIGQVMSNNDTESDVTWATEINPISAGDDESVGKYYMEWPAIYLTPDIINTTHPTYNIDGTLDRTNVDYTKATNPFVIDLNSIQVYEATINPSLGYTKGKKLVKGQDYEVTRGSYDYKTDGTNNDVWIVNLIKDYSHTNKKFVVEYRTHFDDLTVPDNSMEDKSIPMGTEVGINSLFTFTHYNPQTGKMEYHSNPDAGRMTEYFDGDIVGANISLINSNLTTDAATDLRGSVIVTHVDATTGKALKQDGYAIAPDGTEMRNVSVGTTYTTNPEYFDGYQFSSLAYGSDNPDGTVEQGVKHVIYQYTPVAPKGSVDVIYLSENGEILQPWTAVETNQPEGTNYSTEKQDFTGYKFIRMSELSAAPTGTVVADKTLHVIYVYAKVGSVDVKYVDDATGEVLPFDGAKLSAATVADGDDKGQPTTDVVVGTSYTTAEKSFAGYHFVGMDKTSSPVSGKVLADTQHVIYRYAKDTVPASKTGNVDVTYVDTEGNVLPGGETTSVKHDAPVSENYETVKKDFTGYEFKRMGDKSANPTGTVVEGTQHVVYVYAKNPEASKTGNVDVKYIDKATGKVIPGGELTDVKKNAPVGEGYFTEQKDFTAQGYRYVGLAEVSAAAAGLVTEGTHHVVYEYEKIKQGSVDVRYIDKATGQDITPGGEVTPVVTGNAGTAYGTQVKDFTAQGYRFVGMSETSAPADGTVEADKTLHVIYEYEQIKGSVDVIYVDEQGNPLPGGEKTAVKTDAPEGEAYTTPQKTFAGYTFSRMGLNSAATNGKVIGGQTLHVVYVYTKNPEVKKSNVDVTYVTEDGKTLKATELVFKDSQAVGTAYKTEQKEFTGYTFSRMGEFSADANGKVTENLQHVVYVYTKNPEVKKSNVDVTYVTEDGKILKATELVFKDSQAVGTAYKTEQKEFTGYTFSRMGEFSADANGKVTENLQHVVYVYTKNPEVKKSNVDVTYVTEDGKILKTTELVFKDTQAVGTAYKTEQREFTGYHFVRMGEFSADPAGKVTENLQHVVYVYAADPVTKKGSVDVKYITKDGKVLEDVTSVKNNVPVGEEYKTEEKSFGGYHFVGMDKTSDPATGVVAEGTKHVIYVYEKDPVTPTPEVKKGNVDVTYVTEDGKTLKAAEQVFKDAQEVGTAYTTEQEEFTGYHFVRMGEFSADPAGKVTENLQHVVYVYAADPVAKKGSVDVKYITKDGKVLENVTPAKTADDQAATNVKVGTEYTTEEKSFDGYHFVGMDKTSDPATGVVAEGTKHVIYVYVADPVEKKGSVDVKYITKNGKVLEDVTSVKDNAPVGEEYKTEEKPFDGYHFVGMDKTSDPATGVVAEGTKHVIYVYEKDPVTPTPEVKKGNVDVTYVTEDGKTLKAAEQVFKDAQEVGTAYTTEQEEFTGYHFVRMGEFSADPAGKVTENLQHVVYVYAANPVEKKGSVDVKYITKDGKVLKDVTSVKDNAPVGEEYKTEEKTFEGYHFVGMDKTSDPATGVVAEGTKHVIYVYEKDVTPEVKKGTVTVEYVDKNGNPLPGGQQTTVKDNVPVGDKYTTEEKTFDGYHFVGMDKTSDPANGKVTEGTKHVIYVYDKDPEPVVQKGSVDVKYVTTDGKVLEDTTTVKDNVPVGESYTTEEKSFDGYHFVGMDKESDPANGKVTEGTKHVIYVYEKDVTPEVKKGTVTVEYVDKNGNPLPGGQQTTVKNNVPVGEDYTTEEKTFDGYHFVGMDKESDPANGKVTEGTKHVIYVYEKDVTPEVKKGTVTVEYVDKNGNPLPGGQQTTVKNNVPVGEDYTTEEKPFDGYHFVGMDKTSDSANGKVTEGTKHVIYVYEKDVTPEVKRGTVTVEYVDKNGDPLPGGQQTTVKDNVPVGEDYTTEEKTFDGYHFVGMDKTSDSANGKVTEGTKHVIYVYEKDPVAQIGNVDVQYITYVDGKAVELPGGERTPLFTTDQAVDTPYTTNVRNFDNYHFVGMDQSSAAATGKVTNGVQHVIYVYEKNVTPTVQRGSVDVIYVDEHGNPLPGGELTTVKSNEPVGTSYTTTQRKFEGYTFTRMGTGSATPSGTVVPGISHVIYVYTKDEPLPTPKPGIEGGTVTVTYVDEHGNPLPGGEETTVKDKAPVGETYTTTQRDFDGYHFTGMGEGSATPTGTVVPGTTRVIYVYTKDEPLPTPKPGIEGGTVTVTYVDEHGNPLPGGEETPVKDHAPVGETYTTTQRDFPGYTFTGMGEGSATPTGIVVPGTTRVVYVYTKDEPLPTPKPGIEGGTVTVTYVDEHGNPLPGGEETPVKDHAPVGETYTTTQRDFPGYTFTGMGEGSATPTGIVVPGTTRVVYVYTKTPTPTTETPTTPTTSTTPTPTASTSVAPAPVTPVAPSQPTAPASAKLPQTGNQANDSTAALGLAGLGLSALAALGLRKKKNS